MGKPLGSSIADIMDDDGNLLGADEVGEIIFQVKEEKFEQRKVVYYKDEKSTQNKI